MFVMIKEECYKILEKVSNKWKKKNLCWLTTNLYYRLKYLISNENETFYYPFVDSIYDNETNYPFLVKIFDSDNLGYTKLKIKIFEIDYDKFYELKRWTNE